MPSVLGKKEKKCHCFWHFPCKQPIRFQMGTVKGKRVNHRVFYQCLKQKGTVALYYLVSKRNSAAFPKREKDLYLYSAKACRQSTVLVYLYK